MTPRGDLREGSDSWRENQDRLERAERSKVEALVERQRQLLKVELSSRELAVSEKANRIAEDTKAFSEKANRIAEKANRIAEKASKLAWGAIGIAAFAALVALLAFFWEILLSLLGAS